MESAGEGCKLWAGIRKDILRNIPPMDLHYFSRQASVFWNRDVVSSFSHFERGLEGIASLLCLGLLFWIQRLLRYHPLHREWNIISIHSDIFLWPAYYCTSTSSWFLAKTVWYNIIKCSGCQCCLNDWFFFCCKIQWSSFFCQFWEQHSQQKWLFLLWLFKIAFIASRPWLIWYFLFFLAIDWCGINKCLLFYVPSSLCMVLSVWMEPLIAYGLFGEIL